MLSVKQRSGRAWDDIPQKLEHRSLGTRSRRHCIQTKRVRQIRNMAAAPRTFHRGPYFLGWRWTSRQTSCGDWSRRRRHQSGLLATWRRGSQWHANANVIGDKAYRVGIATDGDESLEVTIFLLQEIKLLEVAVDIVTLASRRQRWIDISA